MRKLTLLSLVTASLILIGCGQDKTADTSNGETPKSETVADKANKAVEAVKETASAMAEEATKKASEVVEATTATVKETTTKVVAQTAKMAEDAKKAVESVTHGSSTPPASFAKCAGCHGKDGKTKALGKSEVIAGQSKDDLVKKIGEYKAGTRNVSGMGGLMKGQVAGLSDADVDAIATYLSGLK
jgi:cytochrome c553